MRTRFPLRNQQRIPFDIAYDGGGEESQGIKL